jgi:anaerobic dimethyl sulfoxide reductase subunit A
MSSEKKAEPKIISTCCGDDCGGTCLLKVHVNDGVITRIESDTGEEPQLRACLRGRAYRQRVYASDRLEFPLRREGARGEGKFARISWDEALDTVAGELRRIKGTFGSSAFLYIGVSGGAGRLFHNRGVVSRLLNKFGGYTSHWGNVSAEASCFSSMITYGTFYAGHTRDDLTNSRLIIMWGWNPAETIQTTNTMFYLAKAKEAGAKVVSVDPRFTDSAAILSDHWIPIRPCTDAAMLIAMAHVIIKDNLQDQKFLDTHTVGFGQFKDYVLGFEDDVPKTPSWAEAITGVSTVEIENLARAYATTKPAALITGFAPGRTAFGEQFHRAASTLAAMTGNIGVHGGNPAGHGDVPVGFFLLRNGKYISMPEGDNPVKAKVHISKVWDAILYGRAAGYPSDIKMLYVANANPLNQLPNVNKGVKALGKLEFIVVHELFMTATARFADIVLPINTIFEKNDIARPWVFAPYYIYQNKAIDSLYESKSDFEICCELAARLNIEDYSDKTEDGWLRDIAKLSDDMSASGILDYDTFRKEGTHKIKLSEPFVAFKEQIARPKDHPFPRPSGKIEIYSQQLANMNNPKIPPIPKYFEAWESRNDALAKKYPLQLVTTHFGRRAHSAFDNVPWLKEIEPQAIWINSTDAKERDVKNGDTVLVFNDRGRTMIRAKVTERIMPGVVCIPEGAPYNPDERGWDRGGNSNVLTKDDHSPCGAFSSNTCLVEVQKRDRE